MHLHVALADQSMGENPRAKLCNSMRTNHWVCTSVFYSETAEAVLRVAWEFHVSPYYSFDEATL